MSEIKVIEPKDVIELDGEFAEQYHDTVVEGIDAAKDMRIAVCGIARQIEAVGTLNLMRIERLAKYFQHVDVYIAENDSTDDTPRLLHDWADEVNDDPDGNIQAFVETKTLDRPHLSSERSAERTCALAEYRTRCQEMVSEGIDCGEQYDYVIVMDLDSWGGFLNEGVLTSIAHLERDFEHEYYAMASTALGQMEKLTDSEGKPIWFNYDAWAHRPLWSWRQRPEMWFHYLRFPFGADPVPVNSAFGGLCVYRTNDYLVGKYGGLLFGQGDCEHVVFHRSISVLRGGKMAINPSSVGVMFWVPEDDQETVNASKSA